MKVPHLMSIRPMECWLATLNASSPAMSHALEQTKAARIGVICQGASSAPHFLLARLQGHSFQFVFQVVFPTYTLQLPSCVLPTAFKTFCSKKLGILTGRSWNFSDISSDITGPPAQGSTSLNVNKANGMLTSHAKRIFSGNVTCFGKNKSCSNRSHLPQCFIKALRFLLAWLLCFYTENPRIFFWKAIFATSPIVPAVTIHNLPWKMRVETCHLSFQYGILPGSFPFRAWCGDFQFRGCISTKTLSSKRGLLTGTSRNWRVCPLQAWQ